MGESTINRNAGVGVFGKVAVLMGGQSAERDISLESGQAVVDALLRQGVDAHAIDPGNDVLEVIHQGRFDRAFIALHGRGGEDGQIQGALEVIGVPYTGSDVLGSALAMDKARTKQVWSSLDLPTPGFRIIEDVCEPEAIVADLGLPLMVKPAHEGSSYGASKVERVEQLEEAWRQAARYDHSVLAECWIEGAEFTVAILKEQALPIIRLETPRTFYDFEAKYSDDSTRYLCPCGLSTEKERAIQVLALAAFKAVAASGWGRVDVMIDEKGQPGLIEANTVPGMTSHSLVPMAASASGLDFDNLVLEILSTSLNREHTVDNLINTGPER